MVALMNRCGVAMIGVLLLASPMSGCAQDSAEPSIVPRPASVKMSSGSFELTRATPILVDAALVPLGRRLADALAPAMGYRMTVRSNAMSAGASRVEMRLDDGLLARVGPEGYLLEARPNRVLIRAPNEAGIFYAMQTLRQMLPPRIFAGALQRNVKWTIPAADIEDSPRFAWRGLHLDVGRHFMPKEFVKRYIDLLALHKMNVFHWHLTEDQGWRIEIKKYPRLTQVGAWRSETLIGKRDRADSTKDKYDGTRHGGFYTQAEIREVVAYAADRYVTIVPEIEMPGHAQAAIAAYPRLGVKGDSIAVWPRWGVSENIFNAEDSTVRFLQDVLDEVLALFPGPFIHVGGDEAVKKQWDSDARIQARMRELGVKDAHELQSWFIRQMDDYLTAKGRRLVGWDEILEGGLAPGATVMSWRGIKGGIEAARAGHDVVMTPTTHLYLDYYQSRDTIAEPLAIGGFLPIDSVYAFEPIPSDFTPAEARRVLGAQGNVWTEYMKTPAQVEYMVYPRASALSEIVWSPRARRDYADFRRRLDLHLQRLSALGVNYRKPN
jgi:hexosaminidase